MTDIRCPNCGTYNPEGAEVCFSCGKILPRPDDQPGDQADWLNDLRGGEWRRPTGSLPSEDVQTPSPDNADTGGEVPDWLQRVRANSQADRHQAEAEFNRQLDEAESGGEEPDWLKSLNQAAQSDRRAPVADWLSEETGQPPQAEAQPPQAEAQPPQAGTLPPEAVSPAEPDEPDWMETFRGPRSPKPSTSFEGDEEQPAEQPPVVPDKPASVPVVDQPEWRRELENWTSSHLPTAPIEPKQDEELPDWLAELTRNHFVHLEPGADLTTEAPVQSEEPAASAPHPEEQTAPWISQPSGPPSAEDILNATRLLPIGEDAGEIEPPLPPIDRPGEALTAADLINATRRLPEEEQWEEQAAPAEPQVPAQPANRGDKPPTAADLINATRLLNDETPAWLQQDQATPAPVQPDEDIPDWLRDVISQEAQPEQPPFEDRPSSEEMPAQPQAPTWNTEPAARPPTAADIVNATIQLSEEPEGLQPEGPAEEPAPEETPAEEASPWMPVWSSGAPPTAADMLNATMQLSEEPEGLQPEEPAEGPVPGETGFIEEPAVPAPVDEAETSQWPAEVSETTTAEVEETGEPAPTEATSVPAWLDEFAAETLVANGETPAEAIPGWLDEFAAAGEMPTEGESKPAPTEAIPGWLAAGTEEIAEEGKALPAEHIPEWLSQGQDDVLPEQPLSEEQALPAANLPEWMQDFAAAKDGSPEDEATGPGGEEPVETLAPFIEEDLPGWLQGVKGSTNDVTPPFVEPEEPPISTSSTPFQVDLPSWLSDAEPIFDETAEPAPEESFESLEKADLPSWVEELRPLESIIPDEIRHDPTESIVEKVGPLAGIRGVLPGQGPASGYTKPPVYSSQLAVTERQQTQAALLEEMLEAETIAREIPAAPSRTPQALLRIVIGVLLILSMLTMLLPNFRLASLPAQPPAALTDAYQIVNSLPAGAPVLLAADYEPGLSGEMRFTANSVLEHLLIQDARIVVVSTNITGPALADQLLREVSIRRPEYMLTEKTVNLGYLPGGAASLLEFAQNPRQAAPYATDSTITARMAWDYPALAGVNSLQDFALVIVLTDSPETGRTWIEQVQPSLGSTPMLMVSSAQAAPMLQPYLDSAQIKGLVAGMQGGAQYEQLSGRVNLANRFLGAYQSGSLAGLLLLVFGGILSAAMAFTDRRSAQKGKA